MPPLATVQTWVEERIPALMARHRVPAVSLAIGLGDETFCYAAGVLHRGTGVAADTGSVFQIGSVTKVFTATLVMQLVEEGLLDLDAPVRQVLPRFRVADEEASAAITPRHLLTHSAGFEGDVFVDTGDGDDALETYVGILAETPQLFAPGEMFSYNNAGFSTLGRIVEVLRGAPYERVLRERLLDPLGLRHAAVDASEAILHRAAVGHLVQDDGEVVPTTVWAMERAGAAAGSRLAMSAGDLLAFARLHLAGGAAPDGSPVLDRAAVEAMRTAQIRLPDIAQGAAWGLGWELFARGGHTIPGHDGNTIGQSASLRVLPEQGLAVAALANGGDPHPVFAALVDAVLEEVAGIAAEPLPSPTGPAPAHADRFVGRYRSSTALTTITRTAEGRVWLDRVPHGVVADLGDLPYRTELVGWHGDVLLPVEAEGGVRQPVAFLGDDGGGGALFLHTGRADRRVAS
ncbi:MAG: beta-lactamase family protein [Microbacterium sp.]|jgi:CubicO group peptidase (beta-lactamase class C family)|uniref:serine hydrolase domain-containing protein n=1 Tax=Microbacterium sp. TaxID=51671 RepID=UPI00282B6CC9|nr:serine hydrolase domain-containing protein [Microbacterium sp.]MDR2323110.1 beta-lactamase family protein [Microbacterium sp.]